MAPRKSKSPKSSAQYYRDNPDAARRKAAYDTKYHDTPARRAYRAKLAKARRAKGVMGKGGNDMSHTKSGKLTSEKPSKNRARNRGKR